MLKETIR